MTNNNIKKSSFNINEGLLNINLDNLMTQYYSGEFKDLNISKIETMCSDFKTVLKLVEDLKINSRFDNNKENVSVCDNSVDSKTENLSTQQNKSPKTNVPLIEI